MLPVAIQSRSQLFSFLTPYLLLSLALYSATLSSPLLPSRDNIMSPAAPPYSALQVSSAPDSDRFHSLRSLKWRIHLSILPPSSSVDDLRRLTADSRRRYAALRRRLLFYPLIPKDETNSPNLVMDNPLSQSPDSSWGRFFRNAELEKMVNQDLSRLYPEHGSYFQTLGCQGMLRRILLLWCLRHPDRDYKQGMHELLAPLLYVLHADLERLAQVRTLHEDHFADKFDLLSFHESDLTFNFDIKKFPDYMEDEIGSQGKAERVKIIDELEPEIQTILLLTDAYGAEGELGIVLSEKFMEHDAYCMFDALMSGNHGAVAMADFFSPSVNGAYTTLVPVIEASAALYHLLSLVDSSLHNHLVELGVEPQYFALRWLRVLFGREFPLEDLLLIWDEIFGSDNSKFDESAEDDISTSSGVLISHWGAFISAFAVSMILHLRSSLLATENATTCLQRLLNFPDKIDLKKLVDKAKSLQALALETNISSSSSFLTGDYDRQKEVVARVHRFPSYPISPKTPLSLVPESYWEEKWRVLHKEEEHKEAISGISGSSKKKRWTEKVILSLSRTESDPLATKSESGKKHTKPSVRRSLLQDLSRELGSEEYTDEVRSREIIGREDYSSKKVKVDEQESSKEDCLCTVENRCPIGISGSEETSSIFSFPVSPHTVADNDENDSGRSSVASSLSPDENDDLQGTLVDLVSGFHEVPQKPGCNNDFPEISVTGLKEPKVSSGKFQWLWKFGPKGTGEGPSDKGEDAHEATKFAVSESKQTSAMDRNVIGTLRNIGQSMLDHIQVIESVFQQDQGQMMSSDIVGKGQVTAMAALKELRKISNILSQT